MSERAMTVKELIEELQKMPPDAHVIAENGAGDGKATIESADMQDGIAILQYIAEGLNYQSY